MAMLLNYSDSKYITFIFLNLFSKFFSNLFFLILFLILTYASLLRILEPAIHHLCHQL